MSRAEVKKNKKLIKAKIRTASLKDSKIGPTNGTLIFKLNGVPNKQFNT